MFGISSLPAALQFFGFIYLPESPRWLFKKGEKDNAKEVLRSIHDDKTAQTEYEEIRIALTEELQYDLEGMNYCAYITI